MRRRVWIIVGMVLTIPCLLFTALLVFTIIHSLLLAAFGREWWVENRTAGPIWVTPLGGWNRGPVPLPHYATRLATYSASPFGEVLVRPGERRRLVIDGYAATDAGGHTGVVVRTAVCEHRYCKGTLDGQSAHYIIDDATLLNRASDEMIAAAHRPSRPVLSGIPFWVIVSLGLAAPITLFRLRRSYRNPKPTP
jgi:hypothetical protein